MPFGVCWKVLSASTKLALGKAIWMESDRAENRVEGKARKRNQSKQLAN